MEIEGLFEYITFLLNSVNNVIFGKSVIHELILAQEVALIPFIHQLNIPLRWIV